MVDLLSRCSWRNVKHQLVVWLGMRYTTYLSQKQHWLVLGCARSFEVWPSSSSRHGLVSGAKANPSRILPLSKSWAQP